MWHDDSVFWVFVALSVSLGVSLAWCAIAHWGSRDKIKRLEDDQEEVLKQYVSRKLK